jgi:SAM-dependent methyltransferase
MALKKKNWYKNWFGNEYLTVYAHRDQKEARQLISLIRSYVDIKPKQKILDLCCGQGRHVLQLAKLGYRVYGVDLSRTLLEVAKFKTNKWESAHFIQADMRHLPISHAFDLLLNLFTSFGYFETDAENESVFHQFSQALKPQGTFVFDYFNASFVEKSLIPYQKERLNGLLVEQERFIEGSRVEKVIKLNREGEQSIFHESVKMYYPDQLCSMMKHAGLDIKYIFGDYDGSELILSSPRVIMIGQRQN